MKNISGMDYENTPFMIPGKMASGKDTPTTINLPYANANRRNIEAIIRNFNANSKSARAALEKLKSEVEIFTIDEESEIVTLHSDGFKRILSLVADLNVAFENLLNSADSGV